MFSGDASNFHLWAYSPKGLGDDAIIIEVKGWNPSWSNLQTLFTDFDSIETIKIWKFRTIHLLILD